jgi:aminoglycoside phosphotransferase
MLREELIRQICNSRATQLLPGKNNRYDHLAQTGSDLPQVLIATCPVDRKNQIVLKSQSPGETTSELPLIMDGP